MPGRLQVNTYTSTIQEIIPVIGSKSPLAWLKMEPMTGMSCETLHAKLLNHLYIHINRLR